MTESIQKSDNTHLVGPNEIEITGFYDQGG